jgi:type IV pilus assembly protein PilY1
MKCFSRLLLSVTKWTPWILLLVLVPEVLWAVDISDSPLEIAVTGPEPALVLIVDNSGSMDCEFMTPQAHGLFNGYYYLFPDSAYDPRADHVHGPGCALSAERRRLWQSQWSGYNRVYYTPEEVYSPWPSTSRYRFDPSNLHRPRSGAAAAALSDPKLVLAGPFLHVNAMNGPLTIINAHYYTLLDKNGNGRWDEAEEKIYLVTWQDADGDGLVDLSGDLAKDCRRYFCVMDDGDGSIEDNELIAENERAVIDAIRPTVTDNSGMAVRFATDREELQNFANWVTYYRRRSQTAIAIAAKFILHAGADNVGLYAINGRPRVPVRSFGTDGTLSDSGHGTERSDALLDALYAMQVGGESALRDALDQVGRYFHRYLDSPLGPSPILEADRGGSCQQAAAILISDGFMNGNDPGVGNADKGSGFPYADSWSETLADVAMHYHREDLAPNVPDTVSPSRCDDAPHQHMTTHVVTFGGQGVLDHLLEDRRPTDGGSIRGGACVSFDQRRSISWPDPLVAKSPELPPVPALSQPIATESVGDPRLDDLMHAAANGGGVYLVGADAEGLSTALKTVVSQTHLPGSASPVAVSGTCLATTSIIFQGRFDPRDWSGDLLALPFRALSDLGGQPDDDPIWRASAALGSETGNWDKRRILSYGGTWRSPQGVPFRTDQLSTKQLAVLKSGRGDMDAVGEPVNLLVDYIRGRPVEGYRNRDSLLGDMIHCAPALFGETVFIGANDGMLHAFDVQSGNERFGYIPNLVIGHLGALSQLDYPDNHRFYVDGPCVVGEVLADENLRRTYLVGGLGKGGKGYFCLKIGERQRAGSQGCGAYHWTFHVDAVDPEATEAAICSMVQWEFPRPEPDDDAMDNDGDGLMDEPGESDQDLGYSYSMAYAVNANSIPDTVAPVVIFGNGYNSDSGKAILYILEAEKGNLIRKIDTGIQGDNGLSTPALIDVNLDRRVDYAYAGDLKGNLWKFDLTAPIPGQWGVAYGTDVDGDGVIDAGGGDVPMPLFQASGQPITGRPDVMLMHSMCGPQAPGYMVIFGTGRYLGNSDLKDRRQQSIFGIWDFGDDSDDSEVAGALMDRSSGLLSSGMIIERQSVADEELASGTMKREIKTNSIHYTMVEDTEDGDGFRGNNREGRQQPNPVGTVGWFFDFPQPRGDTASAERVTGHVEIRGGKAVVVSHAPTGLPCGQGGESWLYVLNACNGDMPVGPGGKPERAERFSGKLHNNPVVLKDAAQSAQDFIVLSNTKTDLFDRNFQGEGLGKVYWRENE